MSKHLDVDISQASLRGMLEAHRQADVLNIEFKLPENHLERLASQVWGPNSLRRALGKFAWLDGGTVDSLHDFHNPSSGSFSTPHLQVC